MAYPGIMGACPAPILLIEIEDPILIGTKLFFGPVGRAVINYDHLKISKALAQHAVQAFSDISPSIVSGHHH
jgi:hypothetical protein